MKIPEYSASLVAFPNISEVIVFHFVLQGFMIADRPAFYGSRSMPDHHRDLRLDIDNMSYEVRLIILS